jgi:hypothetical protein
MIVRKSGNKYTFYRYGGTFEGKNLEVRVGSCPTGINPDAIPHDLMEDLTPKELKYLRGELAKDQQAILEAKIAGIVGDLNDLSSAIGSGLLDAGSVVELNAAASGFLKCARRVVPKSSPKASDANTR